MYKVEHNFIYGWDDAGWTVNYSPDYGSGVYPWRFDTKAEAEAAIDDLIADVANAVANGDMAEEYDRADYRVVSEDNHCTECGGILPPGDESNWCQECCDKDEEPCVDLDKNLLEADEIEESDLMAAAKKYDNIVFGKCPSRGGK